MRAGKQLHFFAIIHIHINTFVHLLTNSVMSLHQRLINPLNSSIDLRIDDTNRSLVYCYLIMRFPLKVTADELQTAFVLPKSMSKPTLYSVIHYLLDNSLVSRPKRGVYKWIAQSSQLKTY